MIYSVERYAKVITEGAEADFFRVVIATEDVVTEAVAENASENPAPLQASDIAENMTRLRIEGYGIDDDNEPASENIPVESVAPTVNSITAPSIYQEWDSIHVNHTF